MAKRASRDLNWAINAVAVENYLESASQEVTQEAPVVTGYADAGPRRVTANYDVKYSADGNNDFASGLLDATIFALVGSAGVASAFDPTGAAAGANDPNYDMTSVVLESYGIRTAIGQPVKFSFGLAGNSALTRAVA